MDGEALTFEQLVGSLTAHRGVLLVYLLALPLVSALVGWAIRRSSTKACGWFLMVPVHLAVLPGLCMTLVVAYLMFFQRENLWAALDIVIYFGPILSMGLTLAAARWLLPFDAIPGFDRLSGLMLTTAVSFGILLVLYRMHFFVGVFAHWEFMVGAFLLAFGLIRLGARKVLGREPAEAEPPLPPSRL